MSAPAPQTKPLPAATWFDAEDAPARVDLNTCIHCGLCLTACPTYRELKIEPDSPRGRIYLMRGLAEGRIAPSDPLIEHLDNCLDCRACETVCPAGVPYSRMLEATRGQLNRRVLRGSPMRLLGEWALRSLLPDRARLDLAVDLLRLGQRGPLGALMHSSTARRMLPEFMTRGLDLTPPLLSRRERALERLGGLLPPGARMEQRADAMFFRPAGSTKMKVAFFRTCVMEPMFPVAHRETVRLLVLAGCEVVVPRAQTCCGALQAHAGLRRTAKDLARRNARAFEALGCDVVVTHSAGCGAALRDAHHLLEEDAAAEKLSRKTRDIAEVLVEVGLPPATTPLHSSRDPAQPLRVAYHDACHLAHAQGVRNAPRALLRQLPGVELRELQNSDWCCGSAGIYNLTHPEMAESQLEQKLDSIERVAPEIVVASNPGCLLHMRRGARARGTDVGIVHLVEVLGTAYPTPSVASGSGTTRA